MDQFKRILARQKREKWLKEYHKELYKNRISMIAEVKRRYAKLVKCLAEPYRHMWE